MKLKKIGLGLVAGIMCLAIGVGFVGCTSDSGVNSGSSPIASSAKKDNDTLVVAAMDYTVLNPVTDKSELTDVIFSGLMTHDAKGNPIKDMADSYSYNPDTITYTFKLKDGIKFHDGKPCTAEDVKFTLDTITKTKDLSSEIKDNFTAIESVNVIDPLTVEIKLSEVNAAMLDYLCVGILPKHLLEGKDVMTDSFNQHPIGTGRYKFGSWDKGQSITVTKNTDFYGKVPNIKNIVFKIVPDENARALQTKSGELDIAWLNAKNTEIFRGDANYQVFDFLSADYRAIAPNFNAPFWKENRELAAVIGYAIDRQSILKSVLAGQGQVAYSPIQLNDTYNNPNVEKYSYNPEKFKEEMTRLGWTMGSGGFYEKNGKKCSFSVDAMESEEERVDIANIVSQQLKKLGVDMKVNIITKIDWDKMDSYLIGQAAPFDVDDGTYTLFGTGKSNNYTHYSNQLVDKYLQEGRATEDVAKRKEAYTKFQEEMAKDPAYIYIAYLIGNYVAIPGLKGPDTTRVLGHHAVGVLWNVEDWTLSR